MPHITITLYADERAALVKLAEVERRDPRAQAALIIRNELQRVGVLAVGEQALAEHPRQLSEVRHASA
jgi:hypothetical protein